MNQLFARARAFGERLESFPDTLKSGIQLGRQSGFVWKLTPPGVLELAKVFTSGSQNPAQIYRVHAKNAPNDLALVYKGRSLTWRELDDRIDRVAASLVRRGIGRKQSLLLMLRNCPEQIEIGAGAARIGGSAVSISWRTTARELAYLAKHSGARGIALDADLLPILAESGVDFGDNVFVIGEIPTDTHGLRVTPCAALLEKAQRPVVDDDCEDAAVVIYTSGTTGTPKGAVRKFPKDTMAAAMRFINVTPMRATDTHLVACPLYHSTAFGFLSLSQVVAAPAVLMDEFKPEAFLQLVERYKVTTTALVPTMVHRLMELPEATRRRYDTRSLRIVFCGGAQLAGPLATRFMDAFGDVLHVFYGATETGLVTLASPEHLRAAPTTIGVAVPGNEIRLLDENKRDVEEGEVGELYVKNKLLVAGYHEDDAATRDSMVDGFFSVGDLARRDRWGRYFIEGRKRDMIISGGTNVYPAEVEHALADHPAIDEVAVIGVPDPEWGERVRAFVVLRAGAELDPALLKEWAKKRLASPKVPRDVVFVPSLPKNPTGKVLKRELRAP
jgi:fatty-acyl-CoA synthase